MGNRMLSMRIVAIAKTSKFRAARSFTADLIAGDFMAKFDHWISQAHHWLMVANRKSTVPERLSGMLRAQRKLSRPDLWEIQLPH